VEAPPIFVPAFAFFPVIHALLGRGTFALNAILNTRSRLLAGRVTSLLAFAWHSFRVFISCALAFGACSTPVPLGACSLGCLSRGETYEKKGCGHQYRSHYGSYRK
jgi:hypothetical protein